MFVLYYEGAAIESFVLIITHSNFKTMNRVLLYAIAQKRWRMTWQIPNNKNVWIGKTMYDFPLYSQLQDKDGCEAESGLWCSSAHACPEGREG